MERRFGKRGFRALKYYAYQQRKLSRRNLPAAKNVHCLNGDQFIDSKRADSCGNLRESHAVSQHKREIALDALIFADRPVTQRCLRRDTCRIIWFELQFTEEKFLPQLQFFRRSSRQFSGNSGGILFFAQRYRCRARRMQPRWARSEEHTSELQSLRHLVCR